MTMAPLRLKGHVFDFVMRQIPDWWCFCSNNNNNNSGISKTYINMLVNTIYIIVNNLMYYNSRLKKNQKSPHFVELWIFNTVWSPHIWSHNTQTLVIPMSWSVGRTKGHALLSHSCITVQVLSFKPPALHSSKALLSLSAFSMIQMQL